MCIALWANAHPYSAYFEQVSLNEILYPGDGDEGVELGELIESPEPPLDEQYALRQLSLRLPAFRATLGPKLRLVFDLYFIDDVAQSLVAKALGMSLSAVSHAITKIIRKARDYFRATLN